MKNNAIFLLKLRNDVFKLLPMRETEKDGVSNHIEEYLTSLIVTAEGAVFTYPELENEKSFIYVVNSLNYLKSNMAIEFASWRKVILNCTRSLDDLKVKFSGGAVSE